MEFAVVLFTDEDNGPGIIATNWMNEEKTKCFYPDVRSEWQKNKLLTTRVSPSSDWLECPIKVLEECANYQSARHFLQKEENRSTLESRRQYKSPRKRKKTIKLSGEKSIKKEVTDSNPVSPHIDPAGKNPASSSGVSSNLLTTQDSLDHNSQGCSSEIMEMKQNQEMMWLALNEYMGTVKRIESKLDLLLQKFQQHVQKDEKGTNFDIILSLPVGMDGFSSLNKQISEEPSIRKSLVKVLMTVGGRDVKAMAANLLRKLVLDDIGEHYSLTGKLWKNGMPKQAFEKTEVYQLIIEICLDNFPYTNTSTVREAIRDWLMQAKFRKSRREQRMRAAAEEGVLQQQYSD